MSDGQDANGLLPFFRSSQESASSQTTSWAMAMPAADSSPARAPALPAAVMQPLRPVTVRPRTYGLLHLPDVGRTCVAAAPMAGSKGLQATFVSAPESRRSSACHPTEHGSQGLPVASASIAS